MLLLWDWRSFTFPQHSRVTSSTFTTRTVTEFFCDCYWSLRPRGDHLLKDLWRLTFDRSDQTGLEWGWPSSSLFLLFHKSGFFFPIKLTFQTRTCNSRHWNFQKKVFKLFILYLLWLHFCSKKSIDRFLWIALLLLKYDIFILFIEADKLKKLVDSDFVKNFYL